MKNLHIEDSYKIWCIHNMRFMINYVCYGKYGSTTPELEFNRNYCSMYIEWWLHNIGYYLTKPLCFIDSIRKINLRCKDVDLEEWN